MHCTNCGKQANVGNRYCAHCGHPLGALGSSTTLSNTLLSINNAKQSQCPKCKGSGRMEFSETGFGVLGNIFTLGMTGLFVDGFGDGIECDMCGGKGWVD